MEASLNRSIRALATRSPRWTSSSQISAASSRNSRRGLQTTSSNSAIPLPHQVLPGPPPQPPQTAATHPQDRLERKKAQAEILRRKQNIPTNPAKPGTALQKRFWKDVFVHETPEGLQIFLDKRPVRTATKQALTIPHNKRALAMAIALEWDQLVSASQALKHHYIPLTSLTSRAMDIAAADAAKSSDIRDGLTKVLLRYLSTDTLLCWAPEKNIHDTEAFNLRKEQKAVAEPIIAFLKTHVFPGVDIVPILAPDSIVPIKQPELTRQVISGWIAGLPAFELAALERGVLATKSLLVATRLLVDWSREFAPQMKEGGFGKMESGVQRQARFGVEEAALAATMEVRHQISQWGEVEDTHDVEHADVRRQLGSAVLLVS